MPARIHVAVPLLPDQALLLPASAARHVQVLRRQPGDELLLFDGRGGEWTARISRIGRSDVEVTVGSAVEPLPELRCAVTLAIGMPANDRMDAVVEKATELGVAALQPLMCERAVLRLHGERAARKQAHWQAIAVAASEQCGRAKVPKVAPVLSLPAWLSDLADGSAPGAPDWRGILSLRDDALPLGQVFGGARVSQRAIFLNGPEGGLTESEESCARAAGFLPVSLGPRVLRADTAPLAVMAWLSLLDPAA